MITRRGPIVCVALALALAAPLPFGAARAQSGATDVDYRAPSDGLVPRRVGGSARSAPVDVPFVAVLTPDHLALTVSEQPTLFWYLSGPTTARIELVVVDPRRPAPLVETRLTGDRAGIHGFDLARAGVRLEPGVQYEWSVAVVVDPAQRSRDVMAGGAIMRIAPAPALREALASGDAAARARALAAAGIWYDALAALSAGDAGARARRALLLEQAGLPEVAAFERRP